MGHQSLKRMPISQYNNNDDDDNNSSSDNSDDIHLSDLAESQEITRQLQSLVKRPIMDILLKKAFDKQTETITGSVRFVTL